MAGRFSRGLGVVDDSIDVFRDNPRLALLPFLSLLATGSAFLVVLGVGLRYGVVESVLENDILRYAGVFAGISISSSVGTFFNAAIVHCASQYFDGESTSVRDGLAAAWRVRRTIALWSVTAATLGTVLYVIDEKFGVFGSAARIMFDLGWALLTFFIVPVIVLEETASLRSLLRESGDAFRETWGESVSASLGVSFVFLPVGVVGLVGLGWAYFFGSGALAFLVGAAGFVVLVGSMVAAQVVGVVARTALYRYAADGERFGPCVGRDLETVFSTE
ncbi:hypothetical protein C440_02678 [Haloferax mucosum ATCC BAA-1512]|uniref:Uncharacterized protein n=1 Tax=Haloferax mucosum ATCC BAA-1512 TaxID=662479 RepID=M0IQ10_9EURY|nr:DUF6159 family protein [Haloferax mucosum]ELZ98117.1 hypothetical protein C440_02678 [Haloferax mucosum ATCC BAA-1512]